MYFVMVVVSVSVYILYVAVCMTVGVVHRSRVGWFRGIAGSRRGIFLGVFRYVGWNRSIFYLYVGTWWHQPRGRGRVGPGLLAEDASSPPTTSWWALETPVTLARRGSGKRPSGGRGGCCNRSGRGSCTAAATTGVLVNTARLNGTESQERVRRR